MQTLEAIAKRKSTRSYTSEPISEENLQIILKAGFAAPVAMAKYDSLHITVVQNEELIGKINDATSQMLFKALGVKKNTDFGAKTLLFVSSTPAAHRAGMEYTNVGIVMENMVLAATALGIDSVILGGAPEVVSNTPELMQALEIPEGYKPLLGCCLGYGAEQTPVKEHTICVNRV